jgi:hypothetical protein
MEKELKPVYSFMIEKLFANAYLLKKEIYIKRVYLYRDDCYEDGKRINVLLYEGYSHRKRKREGEKKKRTISLSNKNIMLLLFTAY